MEQTKVRKQVLFRNVNIFDGKSEDLISGKDVLVENNLIKQIDQNLKVGEGVSIIDGKGNTLMPGLHEQHIHFSIYNPFNFGQRLNMTPFHVGAVSILRAKRMLMNGYTTVRDAGGPSKYLQKVVDAGLSPGPRIYPSEAIITQTSGHADLRNLNDPHPNMNGGVNYSYCEREISFLADGATEIRRAVRENLRRGATQIKITVTGGVTSEADPLHSLQYTPEEIQIAVQTAEQWGTYVFAHCFTEAAIFRAVENGVKTLEHIPFLTDKAAKLMIEKDIMFATAVTPVLAVPVEQAEQMYNPSSFKKWKTVRDAAINMLEVIKRNPKMLSLMTLGSDLINQWEHTLEQDMKMNLEFKYLADFFSCVDILRIATSNGARMNRLTGKNNPYQEGPQGVVVEGAYADLLVVNGDPLEDVVLLADPVKNLLVIMKDGKIYKNTL